MTQRLHDLLPDADVVLHLEPEELAWTLLQFLVQLPPDELHKHNLFTDIGRFAGYPKDKLQQVRMAYLDAWQWLENHGLLVPPYDVMGGQHTLSRRAKAILDRGGFDGFRRSQSLPFDALHPALMPSVYSNFVRGDYSTAVFAAYRAVEIAVRKAAGASDSDYGRELMVKAFRPERGPLADAQTLPSEQEATMHLFSAAIGLFKNPNSHRAVNFDAPEEALEMIHLANLLLRIVDSRSAPAPLG